LKTAARELEKYKIDLVGVKKVSKQSAKKTDMDSI
jgi:hypothetical protein